MILVLLAGDAAQKIYDPDDKSEPSITDYRKVWELSDLLPEATYKRLLTEVKILVKDNFLQIQSVAEALMEVGSMEGGVCGHIIDCVDKGEDWRETPAWRVTKEWEKFN